MGRLESKPALVLNGEGLHGHTGLTSGLIAAGVDVAFRGIDDLAFDIGVGGVRIHEAVTGRDLADFGLVQVAAYQRPTAMLINAVADYLAAHRVHAVNVAGIGAPTKLFKYARLASHGLSIPSTVYLPPRLLADAYLDLAGRLDLPFVMKTVTGGNGRMTSLVSDEAAFVERLCDTHHARVGFLAQEFVPPDGSLFLLVLGGCVSLAMSYVGVDIGDVLTRPDSEEATLLDVDGLDPTAQLTAVQAAAALDYDIAGVHLVRHWTTGRWCILDVSPTPPIGTGEHTAGMLSAYSAYLKRRLTHHSPGAR